VRCVVVSGAGGKAFVSGADISKFESERANAEAQVRYDAISKEGYEGLYNFPKPTIAKITGYCIGGGMNLAACCDMRSATRARALACRRPSWGWATGFLRIERLSVSSACRAPWSSCSPRGSTPRRKPTRWVW